MRSFLATFVIAALLSALLTPLVRILAFKLGAVSPGGGRHVHQHSIPRLGGLAIFAAFFAPLIGLFFVQSTVALAFHGETRRFLGLLIGGTLMCGLGVWDDTRGVRASHKLYVQIAVGIIAFASGFRINAISLPLIGDVSMGIFALPVTLLWIVGIVNALNLIDGLDGLAAGVAFFAALTNFVVAYLADSMFAELLMAATIGAVIGFLFYNFNPARIFMGDSGSYFLGYVLATMALFGGLQKTSTAVSLLVPVIALGVPIVDTLFALVRRFLERRPLFAPDRGHIHHRLLGLGITHRRAVLLIYSVCVVFTVAAICISLGRSWPAGVAMLAASVVLIGLVRFVGYFEYLHLARRQKARVRERDAELLRYALPDFPGFLAEAATEEAVWESLIIFAVRTEIAYFEVLETAAGTERVAFQYTNPQLPPTQERELVSARYPIGRDNVARAVLKFRWRSDFNAVAPQSDILLQVVVDVVERGLVRVRSRYAPEAAAPSASSEVTTSVAPAALEARPSRS